MKKFKSFLFILLAFVFFSCTKLHEEFRSELEQNNSGSVTASSLLVSAYDNLVVLL